MKHKNNPFKLRGYSGPDLFCDREKETEQLIKHAENGVNVTLFSLRRMGKTGLIHHVFHQMEQNRQQKTIYLDVYDTQNLSEFTNKMATAILSAFPAKKSIGKQFIQLLKGFNPVISYDQFTGVPEVSLNFNSEQQKQHTLSGLFHFLEEQKQTVVVAIDEFQQVASYPEKNTEAALRTTIQHLQHVNFIFSGSHKHLLLEMFNSAKRPFFSSTTPLHLDKIERQTYGDFIIRLFSIHNKTITNEALEFTLTWTKQHTYYTQALCNKVFQVSSKNITLETVFVACDTILSEHEAVFFQYRNLLTSGQWSLLAAIAGEDMVYQPTSSDFVSKYQLGNPASVRRSLQALVDKEMVIKEIDSAGNTCYEVYNCFFSRWLNRTRC